mmetsp:Transcript_68917/g.128679  ORF Transcript_68917/g.128679 Transcript_68917/m.128679 type:complete len:188 (+) Transcript_68917:75-638(+)
MKFLFLACALLFGSPAEAGLFWPSVQSRSGGGFLGKTVESSVLDVPAVRSLQEEVSMDMANKTSPEPEASGSVTTTVESNATAGTGRSAATARRGSREESLISSLQHMDDGEDTMGCVAGCRFGEVRHSWTECLEKCVENRLVRSTLMSMLPAEHHAPSAESTGLPERLKLSDEVKRKYRLHRGDEL